VSYSAMGQAEDLCRRNIDCSSTTICASWAGEKQECLPWPCASDAGCAPGYVCSWGYCERTDDSLSCESEGGSWCNAHQACMDPCPSGQSMDSSCACIECPPGTYFSRLLDDCAPDEPLPDGPPPGTTSIPGTTPLPTPEAAPSNALLYVGGAVCVAAVALWIMQS
jgi:hypothetical protein